MSLLEAPAGTAAAQPRELQLWTAVDTFFITFLGKPVDSPLGALGVVGVVLVLLVLFVC